MMAISLMLALSLCICYKLRRSILTFEPKAQGASGSVNAIVRHRCPGPSPRGFENLAPWQNVQVYRSLVTGARNEKSS